MLQNFSGADNFIWWYGVVEDRKDPLFLGRAKVRIFGWHTQDKDKMPTENLPWAYPIIPLDSGKNTVGVKEGDWVIGFFRDSLVAQEPIMMGVIPGIPEEAANPDVGYYDPTPDEELTCDKQPRPPFMCPPEIEFECNEGGGESVGGFSDPSVLPGFGTVFGQLKSEYNKDNGASFPFDANGDGKYNSEDAVLVGYYKTEGGFSSDFQKFSGIGANVVPISRYPLEPYLKEPTTSRLAIGEESDKISETIVAEKKATLASSDAASHESSSVGSDISQDAEAFSEPETPYDPIYPFNHVYESESGHYIEIDDTPLKERMHWYHRSGTFREVHPNGIEVHKVKKKLFTFVLENLFLSSGCSTNMSSAEQFRIRSGKEMNLTSDKNLNMDAGADWNRHVKGNENKRVKGNSYTIIEGDLQLLVEGNIFITCESDIMIKAKGDFLVDAANIKMTAEKVNTLKAGEEVNTDAPFTYFKSQITSGDAIHAKYSDSAGVALPGSPVPLPEAPYISFDRENEAEIKDNVASPKEGFLFPEGPSGDLYKPSSDSNGNLVVLSPSLGAPAELYEAIPTGILEKVTIQYRHTDNSITSWDVVRPIHKLGDLVDRGLYSGNGNGGRDHWRFNKPGEDYPKQMILKIGSTEHLILDSSIRHESI